MSRETESRQAQDQRLLQESLNLIAPIADKVVEAFYDRLFAENPSVRPMFPPVMDLQREKLLKAIIALVTHYSEPEQLVPALSAMGRTHVRYDVGIDHYAIVGQTLLATLREFAGEAWTPEYEGAWTRAYTFAAGTMMQAGAVAGAASGAASEERVAA
jgi:hemoglobin-like flavoprotein